MFEKYILEDIVEDEKLIINYKNKKFIHFEEIDGKKYYIKKVYWRDRRKISILFNLKRDFVKIYLIISEELNKIGIPTAPVKFTYRGWKKFDFFSILVTEDSGVPLGLAIVDYEISEQKKFIDKYFEYYKKMYKSQIYSTGVSIRMWT